MFVSQVAEICHPLTAVNIDFFLHIRKFTEGFVSLLCNRADIATACLENHLYPSTDSFVLVTSDLPGYYVWEDTHTGNPAICSKLLQKFKLEQGLTIILKHSDYHDFFYFATSPEHTHVKDFYHKNLDAFSRFIQLFLSKADKLIKIAGRNRLKLNQESSIDLDLPEASTLQLNTIHLTKRQKECLYWLLKGKTAAETGEILKLSPRTVESYIHHLKRKFQCSTKAELISKALGL